MAAEQTQLELGGTFCKGSRNFPTTDGGGFAIAQMSAVMFRCTVDAESVAYMSDSGTRAEWMRRAERAATDSRRASVRTKLDARRRDGRIGAQWMKEEAPAFVMKLQGSQ